MSLRRRVDTCSPYSRLSLSPRPFEKESLGGKEPEEAKLSPSALSSLSDDPIAPSKHASPPCVPKSLPGSPTDSPRSLDRFLARVAGDLELDGRAVADIKARLKTSHIITEKELREAVAERRLCGLLHPYISEAIAACVCGHPIPFFDLDDYSESKIEIRNPSNFRNGALFVHRIAPVPGTRKGKIAVTWAFDLDLERTTVAELLQRLEALVPDVPVERMRLVFNGFTMAATSTLGSYDVVAGDTLYLYTLRSPNTQVSFLCGPRHGPPPVVLPSAGAACLPSTALASPLAPAAPVAPYAVAAAPGFPACASVPVASPVCGLDGAERGSSSLESAPSLSQSSLSSAASTVAPVLWTASPCQPAAVGAAAPGAPPQAAPTLELRHAQAVLPPSLPGAVLPASMLAPSLQHVAASASLFPAAYAPAPFAPAAVCPQATSSCVGAQNPLTIGQRGDMCLLPQAYDRRVETCSCGACTAFRYTPIAPLTPSCANCPEGAQYATRR
ncbi:hypothetical protein BESB_027500 [Besnoitia besnoiti]|uniref:Ubiquitin-like domain-containing protein n=1 Tax=Besnoitia besnoiti TaxID=94643 RepID=A0A2A9M005_BESBE|nr:uncharacterized protein BESB_027500 [Besnoitia besnoiti]PFH31315.1 hypothetical protein BESB_027500 [Besnoitia besnoiti]